MTVYRPITTKEALARGVSRQQLQREYDQITTSVWLPKREDGRPHTMRTRVLAHHRARPHKAFTSWAALTMHGLQWWVDDIPTVTLASAESRRSRKQPRGSLTPDEEVIPTETVLTTPDANEPTVQAVELTEALVSALRSIKKKNVTWYVVSIEEWSGEEIRAIQLIDAVRRLKRSLRFQEVELVARGRLHARWLRKVWNASDPGAESPMESVLRLIMAGVQIANYKPTWESQVPVFSDGGTDSRSPAGGRPWVTVIDLFCRALKIALFYDGAHHRVNQQFQWDTKVAAFLQSHGYVVLRVTSDMVRDSATLRTVVMQLMLRAMNERTGQNLLGSRSMVR